MHICIPDTREVRPPHGSSYLLYNVHIDGLYHCSLRFKQLLHLHQALTKKFMSGGSGSPCYHQLPPFPPKKLLPLSANQVETRRTQLEKYLQNISQDKEISNSSIFNLFLLEAQRESTRIREDQVHLDIELVNGQKIRLQIVTHDSADAVLTSVCRALGLNDRYHAYFCLCLCGYDVVRDKLIIKRRLSFFEAPFVTLQMAIQQQEQLQNVLSSASANNPNGNHYSATTNYKSNSSSNYNNNNNNNNTICHCLSCSTQQQLQQNTTGVPIVGSSATMTTTSSSSSSSSGFYVNSNNNNLQSNHYNQQQHSNCTSNSNNYYNSQSSSSSSSSSSPALAASYYSSSSNGRRSFVTHRILLRKSYWDPIYDTYLLNDQQALNLLFIQTVYDIKHSLMFVDKDTYHQLESLLASDSKLEYILLARTLKYYNYVHFEPCYSDYPRPRTKVMISIGSKELNMRVLKSPSYIARTTPTASSLSNNSSITNIRPSPLQPPPPQSTTSTSSSSPSSASTASSASSSSSTSSSPPPPSSSSSSSSSSSAVSSSSQTTATTITELQQPQPARRTEAPILYCTSSLIPMGYHHLITKDDIVEEEYNFKVPLIRCWRLTSLETLNCGQSTNIASQHQQQQQQQQQRRQSVASNLTTTAIAGGKRRSLSLFNSVVGNSPPSSNNGSTTSRGSSNSYPSPRQQIISGTDGASLMAALTGENGSTNMFRCNNSHSSGGSDYSTNDNQTSHQFCQHENQRCEQPNGGGGGGGVDTQFSQYELSFEYLVSKDTLKWITISSDQAIFISISLQGVVDELVSKRDGSSSLYDKILGTAGCPATPTTAPVAGATTTATMATPVDPAAFNSNNHRQHQPESFTYMYQDGQQKLLNTSNQQLIDKFGTTLGYSPMNSYALAVARQRQQVRAASSGAIGQATNNYPLIGGGGGGGFNSSAMLTSPPSSSSSSSSSASQARFATSINLSQSLIWGLETDTSAAAAAIRRSQHPATTRTTSSSSNNSSSLGSSQPNTAFEITSFKKAPSPIFNDAFEGVTNADDL